MEKASYCRPDATRRSWVGAFTGSARRTRIVGLEVNDDATDDLFGWAHDEQLVEH